jgi:ketosteroid isomerase-like protein
VGVASLSIAMVHLWPSLSVVAVHYAEDAAVLPPDSAHVDGRANIQAFWKGAIDAGLADLALKAVEVGSSGDMAFEVGEVSFLAPDKTGAPSTVTGKYIVIWKKSADGVWRLYRDIWNANPAK